MRDPARDARESIARQPLGEHAAADPGENYSVHLRYPEILADMRKKLADARAKIEARAKERFEREQAEYQAKLAARKAKAEATGKKPRGKETKPPQEGPGPTDQYNFTDPESRIMKAGSGQHFEQAYNAQASVDIESRLIVGQHLVDALNDKEQLVPAMAALSPVVESVAAVLVDNGYYSEAAVTKVEGQGSPTSSPVVYAATGHRKGRSYIRFVVADRPGVLAGVASIFVDGTHEGIRHAHRHIEIVPTTRRAFGGDELLHIRVVDA